MSEEEFSKCEEGEKKNVSVEFRVFEKKELEGKFRRKEKSKCSLGEKKIKIFVAVRKLKFGKKKCSGRWLPR